MKNYSYKGVIKYTALGFLLGLMLVVNAYLLNRQHGFSGPWFHIFDYSPDFVIIILSPLILGLLFCFLGIRWQQLLAYNKHISNTLTHEQMMSSKADKQLKLLGKVVSQINEAVLISDNQGCILWANEGFTQMTGYPLEEVLGLNPESFLVGPESQQEALKNIRLNMFKGEAVVEELIHYRKDGIPYWASVSVKPIHNEIGEITHYISIETDITARKEKEMDLEAEITERKELEKLLLSNKQKLEQAIEIAQVGAWEVDLRSHLLYLSKELRAMYQIPQQAEMSLEEFFARFNPEDLQHVHQCMEHSAKGDTHEIEYRYWVDGEWRYIISNIAPRHNEAGALIGYAGTAKDITQRKLYELAIRKSEEEKAAVFNNVQTMICLHDTEGTIIDINPAAEKNTGFSREELKGTCLNELVAPEYRNFFGNYLSNLSKNKSANGSFQIIRKDGSKRAWFYQNAVCENKDGKPYVIASVIDITETVLSQNQIERQQQFINQIIDNSPNVIFVMNHQFQLVLYNKAFSELYQWDTRVIPTAPALSKGTQDIFLGDYASLPVLGDGEMIRLEGSIQQPGGTANNQNRFHVIKKCFKDKKGRKHFLCLGMNITDRYQIETDLLAANEMVERSLKVKDQFIANMSHEIRTPLNAVIGFSDLLAESNLNPEQHEYLEIIRTASQNLLSLINNILDLSKMEAGSLTLKNEPLNIIQVVEDVVKIMEAKSRQKGLELRFLKNSNLPGQVMGDQLRLAQILLNLLGNAVKFTDKGYVEVHVREVNGPDDTKHHIAFTVRDTGIGVANEKQALIFERFTQANSETERLYGGTGLGLNIAKGIVDMHGGTLKMESTPGNGTTFHFILPFDKYEGLPSVNFIENTYSEAGTSKERPLKILLAEDNPVNAKLAIQVLKKNNHTVTHVTNGIEVMEILKKEPFDIILMDIQMPVMNGITATEKIRSFGGAAAEIPVVAMTAHSLYGEMQSCFNAGMNGYVSKPFRPEALFTAIREALSNNWQPTPQDVCAQMVTE